MQVVGSERDGRESDGSHVVVPPTPVGVAGALSHLSAQNSGALPETSIEPTSGNARTIDVEADGSGAVTRDSCGDVRCVVPPDLESLFVIAPLAHYLGGAVTIEHGDVPQISIPDRGVERSLPPMPELQDAVADLLNRIVALDRLAVEGRGDGDGLRATVGIDGDWARRARPADRLAAYFDASFTKSWSVGQGMDLAMYVDPTYANVSVLPYLLERPCAIFVPEAATVERDELIQRSLEDFYRAHCPPEVTVDLVSPTRRRGHVRGWLADGVAVDAFKATTTAYENRLAYRDQDDEMAVTVVLNESAMAEEVSRVEHIYRDRAETHGIDVTVKRKLTCEELSEVLERPATFLHYVGHCDEGGLRCADGNLPIDTIEQSRIRTFLLNACGSYHEGQSLIRNGSIAGAVTLNPVIDDQAAKVGTAFAQLVMCGFCIERALRIARRRAIMNKDYVVVGDGTYALGCDDLPGGRIKRRDSDRFTFVLEGNGNVRELAVTVTRSELLEYLHRADVPLEYEGHMVDATDLHERLAAESITM